MLNTNSTPNKSLIMRSKDNQTRLILKALIKYKQPLTRRFLSHETGFEIATLCKLLFVLVHNRKLLKVACIKPCKTTGKKVFHFYLVDGLKLGGLIK